MPNTIAHIGAGGLLVRFLIRGADIKWVYLSCIIPDLSWIVRRLVLLGNADIAHYDLSFYSAIQSSLLLSLILSLAFSTFSRHYWRVFSILSIGSTIHLLLDALQIKLGNGSLMFLPFDMQLTSFKLFWPESLPTYLLTIFGLIYFIFHLKSISQPARDIIIPKGIKLFALIFFLAIYFILPISFFDRLKAENFYYYKVFSDTRTSRIGSTVEFDRERYEYSSGKNCCLLHNDEMIILEGIDLKKSTTISLRGTFIDEKKIRVEMFHVHKGGLRDLMSIFGLAMLGFYWMLLIAVSIKKKHNGVRPS